MRATKSLTLLLVLLLVVSVVPVAAQEDEEIEFTGQIVAIDENAGTIDVGVEDEDGNVVTYTVLMPVDFDWESIEVGDTVEVEAVIDEDGNFVATKVVNETEEEEEEEEEEGEGPYFCRPDAAFNHPVGERLADIYGVEYEQVMAWKCEGHHGFGQIVHALRIAASGDEAVQFLDRRVAGEGWGQIWQDLGLVGRPDDGEGNGNGNGNSNGNANGHNNGNGNSNGNGRGNGHSNGNGRGNGPPDHSNAGGRNK